jgi:hypothetical protein
MAPHELELRGGRVCWHGQPVSVIFMDFNTDILLDLHKKYDLSPLLQAVREGRVINPRGTEPINVKSMFEIITDPQYRNRFHSETAMRTPWTRRFYPRQTIGPSGEHIADLVEWTRTHWNNLVLKPERGYSGKGVSVGGVHDKIDEIIEDALAGSQHGNYIVQEKIPLDLWAEAIPELDDKNYSIANKLYQTDFRCLFGHHGLFGFLCRYGDVPTNVGSGGGVQPLAVLKSDMSIRDATLRINDVLLKMEYASIRNAVDDQKNMALDNSFTYLLGPIKIAVRPRLITMGQMESLGRYCSFIWKDCLVLERMWYAGELDHVVTIEPEELRIVESQPWKGSPAIFAADGLFSFGAHKK